MTIEEFQTIDLEEEQDPPSFTEGKAKALKAKQLQVMIYSHIWSRLLHVYDWNIQNENDVERILSMSNDRNAWF